MKEMLILNRDWLGRIILLSKTYFMRERLGKIGLGLWMGSAIAVAILPSPKLGSIAKGYLTLYFVVFEYLIVFGTVIATLTWLIQEHGQASVTATTQWAKCLELCWRVLFSPVMAALILVISGLLMYLPLVVGHIVQLALYGEYLGDTVYKPESILYPFNWLHFLVYGQ